MYYCIEKLGNNVNNNQENIGEILGKLEKYQEIFNTNVLHSINYN